MIDDEAEPSESTVEQDVTTVSWSHIYPGPGGAGYYITGLVGGIDCGEGGGSGTCLADKLDFSLMPWLSSTQITELRQRIASSSSDRSRISVIVKGQWRAVLVRDHRTGQSYHRIDFQVTTVYEATAAVQQHVTSFFHIYGTTTQRAQPITLQHTLPFITTVQFPGPVIANSYGVVPDAFITGTVVQAPTPGVPGNIVADQYFRRL